MGTDRNSPTDAGAERGDSLGRLIARAGPRAEPPELLEAQVRAAVRAEWQSVTDGRRRRKYMIVAAAAVVAFAAVGLSSLLPRPETAAPDPIGRIVRAHGDVRFVATDGHVVRIGAAPFTQEIRAGEAVVTGAAGGINLAVAGEVSVRLAPSTHLEWLDAHRARLLSGAVYVDSPLRGDAAYIAIETAYGRVTHFGTQYLVALGASGLTVRVREGVVAFNAGAVREIANAAEELTIDDGGQVSRARVDPFGPPWQWVEALAGEFEIANRSVLEFLEWAGRETGRPVEFTDEALRLEARSAMLKGSTRGLTVAQAIDAVMSTTNLAADSTDGRIRVTRRR